MNNDIADLRTEYASRELLETNMAPNPVSQFETWWREALDSAIPEPNAMTLATASSDGIPAARIVLLKGFSQKGFIFYSNYKSFKAVQLNENPKACLVFLWKELERQVRITGLVNKIPEKESDEYFLSRPRGSQIGAWASPQSQVIDHREWLQREFEKLTKQFDGQELNRPPHWGGYLVQPVIVEFWQGRPSRMHDRIQYSLDEKGSWKKERLAP